jgi:hypothetical protein
VPANQRRKCPFVALDKEALQQLAVGQATGSFRRREFPDESKNRARLISWHVLNLGFVHPNNSCPEMAKRRMFFKIGFQLIALIATE